MYNSVHCVANCTEAENESKHKKRQLRATTFIVKRLATMTRRLVVKGLSLMTVNIWTAYIHTDRDLNEQVLFKGSVLYPLLLSCQPKVTVTSCFVYKVNQD